MSTTIELKPPATAGMRAYAVWHGMTIDHVQDEWASLPQADRMRAKWEAVGVAVEGADRDARDLNTRDEKRHRGDDWPRRYEVALPRHSRCGSAKVGTLNFDRWFTDGGASLYLHVWHKDGETIHRVQCAYTSTPRLSWEGGVLWWLVDPKGEQAAQRES